MARGKPNTRGRAKDLKNKNSESEAYDLSEEDLELKNQLELYVERIQDADLGLQKIALESMRNEIRTATSSMTSVPKPLKFLRPHYGTLQAHYKQMPNSDLKKLLADILSVLALTMSPEGKRESLKYRLLGSNGDIGSWGHEYVRNLAGEIAQEDVHAKHQSDEVGMGDMFELVGQIVKFYLKNNAEPEAVDLLLEVKLEDNLDMLIKNVDETNYKRTCLYLTSITKYLYDPEDMLVVDTAKAIYMKYKEYPSALRIALYLDKLENVEELFKLCRDVLVKKQLCYILARHGVTLELDEDMVADEEERKTLQHIINNNKMNEGYLTLARDVEVMDPKSPEDVYKAHLLRHPIFKWMRSGAARTDYSSVHNLAATFVNAFVNAGFGQDKLMTVPSSESWLFKHNGHGIASAAASLGMIHLWNVESGPNELDKYFHSTDTRVVAGALIGYGIVNCNIQHEDDPVESLLADSLDNENSLIRIGAIMGLGLAYAGTRRESVGERLLKIIRDRKSCVDVIAFTAIALGLVYVGSGNEEIDKAITLALEYVIEMELWEPIGRFLPVGLGLLCLGKKDSVDEVNEQVDDTDEVDDQVDDTDEVDDTAKVFIEDVEKYCDMTLLACAYAGTGNVLKVQKFLGQCDQHLQKGEAYQGSAVLGIAMVAMGEELGTEMAIRSLGHLLKYGEQNIRKAVPLALGLLCISNPKVNVMDTLSRLSHDADEKVATASIVSLGLIGAGTNNARIAKMLRNLSSDYNRNDIILFSVRIAQGLTHMGKGLLTLSPYHSEHFLLSPTSMAGLVIMLHACLDIRIIEKYSFVLYFLTLAMHPRMLMTVDENLKPLSVLVRVGQAVDVVAQAGRPKTITGFQTHSTPILLSAGERAELTTEKYIPLSPVLEGFVILRENPDYRE